MAALEAEARQAGLSRWEGAEAGIDAEGVEDWEAGPAFAIPLPFFDDGSERAAVVLARMAEVRHRGTAAARQAVEEIRTSLAASHPRVGRLAEEAEDAELPLEERKASVEGADLLREGGRLGRHVERGPHGLGHGAAQARVRPVGTVGAGEQSVDVLREPEVEPRVPPALHRAQGDGEDRVGQEPLPARLRLGGADPRQGRLEFG